MTRRTGTARVSEYADLRGLSVAMVEQAVRDLTSKRKPLVKRLDALLFLVSDDFEVWKSVAGAEHINPWKLLPRLRIAKRKLSRVKGEQI